MRNLVVLAALMGGAGLVAGCQTSDYHHVDTRNRPADYNYAYTATRDTEWKATTASDSMGGTLTRGTTVHFDRSADSSMTWQQARLDDGSIRYVHPADFRSGQ